MDNQQLRNKIAAELSRQRLPRAYIERLLEELDDHLTDLQEERDAKMHTARTPDTTQAIGLHEESQVSDKDLVSRMGDPTQLATLVAKQYRQRNFLGRHPILTFFVLPVPLIVLQIVGIVATLFLLGKVLNAVKSLEGLNDQDYPLLSGILLSLISWTILVLPPLMAALLICRVARKNQLDWRWSAASCVLVALFCALFATSWQLPTSPGNGSFVMGLGFSWSNRWIALTFLPKFAVALGVGWLLVLRSERLREPENYDDTSSLLRRAA